MDYHCIAEQGTRYEVDLKLFRAMVYTDGTYNPTRRPAQQQEQPQDTQASAQPMQSSPAVVGVAASGLNHGAGIGGNYTGPEYRPGSTDVGAFPSRRSR